MRGDDMRKNLENESEERSYLLKKTQQSWPIAIVSSAEKSSYASSKVRATICGPAGSSVTSWFSSLSIGQLQETRERRAADKPELIT
jgi:hypothetical protein